MWCFYVLMISWMMLNKYSRVVGDLGHRDARVMSLQKLHNIQILLLNYGHLFNRRTDVIPQDLDKSRDVLPFNQ